MKIAFVGGRGFHSNYGGVENAIREISSRLASAGLEVDVYGQGSASGFSKEQIKPGLVAIGAPTVFSRFKGNAVLAFVNCLYALVMRRPKVLLLFASGPSLLSIFARLMGVRVIAALRAIDSKRDKWGAVSASVLRLGEYSALNVAHSCTVNSLEMYRYYNGEARGLHYIPNGATDAAAGDDKVLAELGLKPDSYLLFAARLDPVKRLHVLLQAYRQLPAETRLPLVIAGGQCKSPEYRQQLDDLACDGVKFVGHVTKDTLDPLMRHCAIFVLPSILEGMSNSLLAAMNRGRCVLCADVDANSDVVLREPDVLFEADNVDALANRLAEYCGSPERRRACGQKMQQIVAQHYSWDATSESYRQLIERISR